MVEQRYLKRASQLSKMSRKLYCLVWKTTTNVLGLLMCKLITIYCQFARPVYWMQLLIRLREVKFHIWLDQGVLWTKSPNHVKTSTYFNTFAFFIFDYGSWFLNQHIVVQEIKYMLSLILIKITIIFFLKKFLWSNFNSLVVGTSLECLEVYKELSNSPNKHPAIENGQS